jgi:hypothetical protein
MYDLKLEFMIVHFMFCLMYTDPFLLSILLVLDTLLLYVLNKIIIRQLHVSFLQ